MDYGQPEAKRPRTNPPNHLPPPPQWPQSNNAPPSIENPRHLPPLTSFPQSHQSSPFQRPQDHSAPRRLSEQNEPPRFDYPDSRRPPSRPSHGYQPPHNGGPPQFNGQRDHTQREHPAPVQMMKREASEDQHPYGRSPGDQGSNHHAYPSQPLDGNQPYQHRPQPPQQHVIPPQYDSPHQPPPPSRHNSNSYPPPSPVNMGTPDQYAQYQRPSNAGEQYAQLAYPQPGTPRAPPEIKRKAQRASQACDSCRTLKAKCDEGRPACGNCKEKGQICNYKDPPPKQPDRGTADILEILNRNSATMDRLGEDIGSFRNDMLSRISALESIVSRASNSTSYGAIDTVPSQFQQIPQQPQQNSYARVEMNPEGPFVRRDGPSYPQERPHSAGIETIEPMPHGNASDDEDNAEPRKPQPPAIPVDHTTGAVRLLNAPGIKELVEDLIGHNKRVRTHKYPMLDEERRGTLRLFGCGEGAESTFGYDNVQESILDEISNEAASETSSPAPCNEDDYGQVGGLTPPPMSSGVELIRGVINSNGLPPLHRETIDRLVDSYKANIHILHPLFLPGQLNMLVEQFLRDIPETQVRSKVVASFVNARDTPRGKRKYPSDSPSHAEPPELPQPRSHFDDRKPGHPSRNMTSAIVLLVLALGEICLHKDKIPDITRVQVDRVSSPIIRSNGIPISPVQQSPLGVVPTPPDVTGSRRASIDINYPGRDRVKPRNIDIIPGLAYFAIATDILGNQLGGNKLQHVHANILAGLYHGQLGRIIESHAYIHQACYGLESVMRRKRSRYKKVDGQLPNLLPRDNQVVVTFWTCLQLESDIVAEIPVPTSNILTYEEDMISPNFASAHTGVRNELEERVFLSYSAQLFMRKHLNDIHTYFYNSSATFADIMKNIKVIEEAVSDRNLQLVASLFTWDTASGEPATDILSARLRAKYYGAQMITYRPFILKILEVQRPDVPIGAVNQTWTRDANDPRVEVVDNKIVDPLIEDYVKKGIAALVHSTRAFHGVVDCSRQRLLVTNVWGTAHAQWGNMMTLTACYNDDTLKPLVLNIITKEKLIGILRKTIGFLNFTATRTSALATDALILKHAAVNAKLLEADDHGSLSGNSNGHTGPDSLGGSFTSVNSGHTPATADHPMAGYN